MSLAITQNLEWLCFYDNRTTIKEKRNGANVGKYLACVGYKDHWRIYEVAGGTTLSDVWICSLEDALQIAQYIDSHYGDYLGIYGIWLKSDVIGIARLSVPDGEKIYNAVQELGKLNRTVSYNDFIQLLSHG